MACRKWERAQDMAAANEPRIEYCQTCKKSGHKTSEYQNNLVPKLPIPIVARVSTTSPTSKCRNSQTTRRPAIQVNVPVCHHCNRRGHTRRNCFLLNGSPTNDLTNRTYVSLRDEEQNLLWAQPRNSGLRETKSRGQRRAQPCGG